MSYVTGSHSIKVGYQGAYFMYDRRTLVNEPQMRYTFNNGSPTNVAYFLTPYFDFSDRTETNAVYVQDQWTLGRLTLQGALRYDHVTAWAPGDKQGSTETSPFNPTPIAFDTTTSISGYNDINARFGLAYDIFGTGRTALKVNVGRYLSAATTDGIYSANNPAIKLVTNASRTWVDNDRDFVVDCNLLATGAQSPAATGSVDNCGGLIGANQNFGLLNPSLVQIDPAITEGWGVRPYNWQFGASVQHEILPRVSVDVGYNRRWWGNFFTTVNTLVNASDYETWTVPVPNDPRLADAGQTASFVAITPAASSRGSQTFQSKETNFAPASTVYWHGVDYQATARLASGLTLQGGGSTGRGVRNTCELWKAVPQQQGSNRADACDVTEPWLSTLRGLASYTVPRADVLVSLILRSNRTSASGTVGSNGSSLNANYRIPNTVVVGLLGRLPAGGQANGSTTVNLATPGMLYPERRTQADMRFAKILRFGRSRYDIGVDLYNMLNANSALNYDQTYQYTDNGATWLVPTSITQPRLVRFNVTMTF
jgi:hypothetical protein